MDWCACQRVPLRPPMRPPGNPQLKAKWWRRYKPLPPITPEERARLIAEFIARRGVTVVPTNYRPEP